MRYEVDYSVANNEGQYKDYSIIVNSETFEDVYSKVVKHAKTTDIIVKNVREWKEEIVVLGWRNIDSIS